MNKSIVKVVAMTAFVAVLALPAHAAGSGMPWEGPLQSVLESIEGPVARILATIVIILTGLALAFGESGGGMRKLLQIVFGLSIAFAATSFFYPSSPLAAGRHSDANHPRASTWL